jgi:hypothetical protein
MDTIPMLVCLNLLAIILVAFFAGCFGDSTYLGARFSALFGAGAALSLSLLGWTIYVVVHFISKFW